MHVYILVYIYLSLSLSIYIYNLYTALPLIIYTVMFSLYLLMILSCPGTPITHALYSQSTALLKEFPIAGEISCPVTERMVPCLAFQASVAVKVARERRARAEAKESRLHKSAWVRLAMDCQAFHICQSERNGAVYSLHQATVITFNLLWPQVLLVTTAERTTCL